MTVINLDLDKKFKNVNLKRDVVAGEKTYHLTFDDAMYQKIADLQVAEVSLLDDLDKEKDSFINDMDVDQRKKFINKTLNEGLERLENSLDTILGKGEGKRLYNYYSKSTYLLGRVANELVMLNDQINADKQENRAERRKALRKHYSKKKRD